MKKNILLVLLIVAVSSALAEMATPNRHCTPDGHSCDWGNECCLDSYCAPSPIGSTCRRIDTPPTTTAIPLENLIEALCHSRRPAVETINSSCVC